MNIKLSARMEAIANLVTPGSRLADVGCDHAFLPIELCRTGRIPSAIAMDVRPGPLARAEEHIASCGLEDRITVRLSDGLRELRDGEADTVLIAGMGGLLIARILKGDGEVRNPAGVLFPADAAERMPTSHALPAGVTELVLAPQSEVAEVRRCIRAIGFVITEEDMVLEDGKYYPLLKAARGAENAAVSGPAPGETENGAETGFAAAGISEGDMRREMEDAFGPILLDRRHPVLYKWLAKELAVTDDILDSLRDLSLRLPDRDNLRKRAKELEEKRALLLAALRCFSE